MRVKDSSVIQMCLPCVLACCTNYTPPRCTPHHLDCTDHSPPNCCTGCTGNIHLQHQPCLSGWQMKSFFWSPCLRHQRPRRKGSEGSACPWPRPASWWWLVTGGAGTGSVKSAGGGTGWLGFLAQAAGPSQPICDYSNRSKAVSSARLFWLGLCFWFNINYTVFNSAEKRQAEKLASERS